MLFWTVSTISRSWFLFKALRTIFTCIFYNKPLSTSVNYSNKNVVQSTTFSTLPAERCNSYNVRRGGWRMLYNLQHSPPSAPNVVAVTTKPVPVAPRHRATISPPRHDLTVVPLAIVTHHRVTTSPPRHAQTTSKYPHAAGIHSPKPKRKTGNCEENRSFVECGVILAIFLFLVLE